MMAGPWYIVVGGSEIDIDATYGTKTTGMIGTGMPPLTHNVSEQALTPGGIVPGVEDPAAGIAAQYSVLGCDAGGFPQHPQGSGRRHQAELWRHAGAGRAAL